MRRIAIVGSGVAGLLTAHGLLAAGHQVTLYSDRSAEQWLWESRPTGTAARFEPALAYERELGLNYWEQVAPPFVGAHLLYCPTPGNRLATLTGRQSEPGIAVDVRLQSHRWMHDLAARGGRIEIERVNVSRLETIAAEHDLTVVAAGKGELGELFERDAQRSIYAAPQRNVAMVIVKGLNGLPAGLPFSGVKNNLFEGIGEAVWIPFFHRDAGPCWSLIFEARSGSVMDIFRSARTGAEAVECARRTIESLMPWDVPWARDMELADELGWLVGSITPTVKRPVAHLPSGRPVTCIGDTAVIFDPLAAQGANNGAKMARHMVRAVVERGEHPLDADWMQRTFDQFWAQEGEPAFALTHIMLEPLSAAGRLLLISQYGSDGQRVDGVQALADAFAAAFSDPRDILPALREMPAARELVSRTTGRSWWSAALRGALGIARGQLRQALGLNPGHPGG